VNKNLLWGRSQLAAPVSSPAPDRVWSTRYTLSRHLLHEWDLQLGAGPATDHHLVTTSCLFTQEYFKVYSIALTCPDAYSKHLKSSLARHYWLCAT
jgi:hypothetical protein